MFTINDSFPIYFLIKFLAYSAWILLAIFWFHLPMKRRIIKSSGYGVARVLIGLGLLFPYMWIGQTLAESRSHIVSTQSDNIIMMILLAVTHLLGWVVFMALFKLDYPTIKWNGKKELSWLAGGTVVYPLPVTYCFQAFTEHKI